MDKKTFDSDLAGGVRQLAIWGHTQREIALALAIPRVDVAQLYGKEYAEGKLTIQKKLRTAQLDKAYSGNVAMLIHLGKFYLGQNEQALSETMGTEESILDKATTAELLSIVQAIK